MMIALIRSFSRNCKSQMRTMRTHIYACLTTQLDHAAHLTFLLAIVHGRAFLDAHLFDNQQRFCTSITNTRLRNTKKMGYDARLSVPSATPERLRIMNKSIGTKAAHQKLN
jgi:hypothetical protein